MLSSKLWEARRAIWKCEAGGEVRNRLLDVWLLEAQQCGLLERVSMLYSVLPWEQYGHLGAGVTLLYTAELFGSSRAERDKCRASVKVSEEELEELVLLGCGMLEAERLPEIPPAVKQLLDRIVSSPYFNAEQPGGLVMNCLDDMQQSEALQELRGELLGIYTPTEDRSVFGYLSWEQVKSGALTSLGNSILGRMHARAIAEGVMKVEEKVEQLRGSWPACLQEMKSSRFIKQLFTSRPPKSTVPHSHALLDCIEHTWLWMLDSDINVYSTVPRVTYSKLSQCDEGVMGRRFDDEVLPREVEKTLRRREIEAYLTGDPALKVNGYSDCDNPDILIALENLKSEYIDRGFQETLLPAELAPWVARDPQDLDEGVKMKCWLWHSGFGSLRLHPELLRKGGVDDEELEFAEECDKYQCSEEEGAFENRRGFLVPDTMSPLEPAKYNWAPAIVHPSWGRRHRIRVKPSLSSLLSSSSSSGAMTSSGAFFERLLSDKLWQARRVIEQCEASAAVRNRLLDHWVMEAQQCRLLERVSMLYSVLPWEQYGHLGAGVTLLYTAELFGSSQKERDECRKWVKVSEKELDEVVRLGCRMLETGWLPEIPPAVKQLLDRIVSSPYFNKEKPGSLVMNYLNGVLGRGVAGDRREELEKLRGQLDAIYTPTDDSSVFGYLSWVQVKGGALTSLANRGLGRRHAKAIAQGLIEVDKGVEQLVRLWPACILEMKSSQIVKDHLTKRPPKSTAPHSHNLLDCIEHTWLWMIKSNINVYSTVPGVTYSNLSQCDDAGKGATDCRFKNDALPRGVEKTLRRMAIEAHLAGSPEPKVDTSQDPDIVRQVEAMKAMYIGCGFREILFPEEWSPWVARDPQDLELELELEEGVRMNRWLWNPDFRGLHLHPERLRRGGVQLGNKKYEKYESTGAGVPFKTRHRMAVAEIISPLDPDSYMRAPDLAIPPGMRRLESLSLSQPPAKKHEAKRASSAPILSII